MLLRIVKYLTRLCRLFRGVGWRHRNPISLPLPSMIAPPPPSSLQAGELASQVAAAPPGSSEALLALYARMIALYGEARSHVRNALKASSGEGGGAEHWGGGGGSATAVECIRRR